MLRSNEDIIFQDASEKFMSMFKKNPKPWAELVVGDIDTENWVVTLRPKESGEDWKKMMRTIGAGKLTLSKAH